MNIESETVDERATPDSLAEIQALNEAKALARAGKLDRLPNFRARNAGAPPMSDEYGTPPDLFAKLDEAFGPFTIDVAATRENTLVPGSFLSKAEDAPTLHLGSHVPWMNPPYSRGNLERFMGWMKREVIRSVPRACCLVPAYTGEGWWQRHVWNTADHGMWTNPLGPFHGIDEMWVAGTGLFIRRQWAHLSVLVHFVAGRIEFVCPPHVEANGARYSSAVVVYERSHE